MKKIIKLTESDLMRIVKRVLNEQSGSADLYIDQKAQSGLNNKKTQNLPPKNIIPKYCINDVEIWHDVDDTAQETGTWILKGNKIQLNYDKRTLLGIPLPKSDSDLLDKPIDLFVDLDCTSPLRDIEDISKAIIQFRTSDVDAVFSVCEARKNPYFNMIEIVEGYQSICKKLPIPILRRQDAPKVYEHVAYIYVLSPNFLRNGKGLLSGKTHGYDIGPSKSLDIDSEFDFELIEYLMKKRLGL